MKILVYSKAPIWWTKEEWESKEIRENHGIKLIKLFG